VVEPHIRVVGLEGLIRDLKAVAPQLAPKVRAANLAFANRLVPLVRRRYEEFYPRAGSDRASTGRSAREGIRASAGQGRSSIVIGGPRAPHLPGQEFGSGSAKSAFTRLMDRAARATFSQFGTGLLARERSSARGFYPQFAPFTSRQGRFLYPVIREAVPGMVEEYYELLDSALEAAFPDSGEWAAPHRFEGIPVIAARRRAA